MSNTLKARLKIAAVTVATTVSISGALVALPQIAKADAISDLLAQIAQLQAQIQALQGGSTGGMGTGLSLTQNLQRGSSGQQVTDLQTALKTDATVYPEGLVTGFFGALTEKAVQRFQAKYSIVSSGTPATTGYGRVGPKTRAKLNEVFGGTGGGTTGGGTGTGTGGGTTTAGSGLTVSAAAQPSETLAPENAARVPFTRITLTASNDGDVTVKSITVKREGLGDDAVFADIILLDENGQQIGNSKNLNSNHQTSLDKAFIVPKGTSKTLTIAGNMASSLDNYAGQIVKLSVVAVDAGSATVSGSLPIVGNGMTMNGNLTLGSATMSRGATDPGANASSKEVGTVGYTFSGVKLTAGSGEDLSVKSIRFNQSGSASEGDLKNVVIIANGVSYPATVSGDYYYASFGDGITVVKGGNLDISIKGDIVSGSSRTIIMDVEKRTDIVSMGKLYGYYITPAAGSNTSATAGGFSAANVEPYYKGYTVTVGTGTLRIEKSNAVAAGNVAVEINGTNIGAFTFEAKGENVQITNFPLNFTFSGTGTSSDVTSVQIVDSNGSVVAGPKDPSSGVVTFTDTWTVPSGTNVYKVQAKLDSTFVTNDTITVAVLPSGITAKGEVTGKSVTPTPSTYTQANTMTVRAAALSVSVSPSPVAQTIVRGINGFLFSKIQYDASNSGEDVRVTSQAITFTTSATADADDLNNCIAYDGTTALNTGSNVTNPSGNAVGADPTATMTFDNQLIVPKGSTKTVDIKCNIANSFVAGQTISVGVATGQDTNATGVTTGNSITESVTQGLGSTMTVQSGGSFTIALDTSSPAERWGIAGSADQVMTVLKVHATNEAMRLERIQLTFSSTTASTTDFTKVTLWDGATKVGEAVFAGSATLATSTLSGDFIVPKDGDKLLTVKADLASVGTSQPGTSGHLLAISLNGIATTSTSAIGQSSGSSFNSSTASDVNGNGVRLVKAYPTLTRMSIPSNTLTNGSMILYRFSVTAPSSGDVGLFKFTFSVSSTTAATTSNFYVYGYSDSGFSVTPAGYTSPLNARQVDTIGEDSLNGAASTTEVEVYFDPVTNSSSAPNGEAIQVPAGTTRYFELRGTVASATAGDAITVNLLGDAAYFTLTSNRFVEPAGTVDAITTNNDFVWSPNTTSTSATTTNDWTNGFRLPGLGSTNMESQIISK